MSGGVGDGGDVNTRRGEKESNEEVPLPNLAGREVEKWWERLRPERIRPEECEEEMEKRLRDKKSKVEEWLMREGLGSSEIDSI